MLEILNTAAAIGTFLVIAASAIAAVFQLRHLRMNNQLEGLLSVLARVEDSNFNRWVTDAQRQLPVLLADPEYRQSILEGTYDRDVAWLNLANSYDWVGSLVKNKLIPEEAFLDVYSFRVKHAWKIIEPVAALIRPEQGNATWENFEYLYVRAVDYENKYVDGTYPKRVRRVALPPFSVPALCASRTHTLRRLQMSLEIVNTIASVGTFVVIGATAIAAVIQLRHMRASNQLEGLLSVLARVEDTNFNKWLTDTQRQLPELLADPVYVQSILESTFDRNVAWLQLGNSYDWVGSLVKNRLIPEDAFLDVYAFRVMQAWEMMAPITVLARHDVGNSIWENFEYLYIRACQWSSRHRESNYPKHVPRANLPAFESIVPSREHVL